MRRITLTLVCTAVAFAMPPFTASAPAQVVYTAAPVSYYDNVGASVASAHLNNAGQVAAIIRPGGPFPLGDLPILYTPGIGTQTLPALPTPEPSRRLSRLIINNAGQVATAGSSDSPYFPGPYAFRYSNAGGWRSLGGLVAGPGATATPSGMNDLGQVVGTANTATGLSHAFRYTDGAGMVDLGTLGGTSSNAIGFNTQGRVIGVSTTASGDAHAFRYTDGVGMIDLGTLGGRASNPTGIDAQGRVIGVSTTAAGAWHAFRYTDGAGMIDLGTLGGTSSYATAGNDNGQVSGYSTTAAGATHAFRYTDGVGMVDLGTLPGAVESRATAMNALGVLVGNSGGGAPFVYRDGLGMLDLNSVFGAQRPFVLRAVYDINDNGQILVSGYENIILGRNVLLLLTPVPEPSSLALAGCALAAWAARGRARSWDRKIGICGQAPSDYPEFASSWSAAASTASRSTRTRC